MLGLSVYIYIHIMMKSGPTTKRSSAGTATVRIPAISGPASELSAAKRSSTRYGVIHSIGVFLYKYLA